jgi:hypothetical protein
VQLEPRDHQRASLVTASVAGCGELYMTGHFRRVELWGFLTSWTLSSLAYVLQIVGMRAKRRRYSL